MRLDIASRETRCWFNSSKIFPKMLFQYEPAEAILQAFLQFIKKIFLGLFCQLMNTLMWILMNLKA